MKQKSKAPAAAAARTAGADTPPGSEDAGTAGMGRDVAAGSEASASPDQATAMDIDQNIDDEGPKDKDTTELAAALAILPDTDIRNSAPVARIMKNALPENAKIAKEAKECMQECVSEFISFITSEGRLFPELMCL